MIHIKETEIIPLLKEAQTEYSQKITEDGNVPTLTSRMGTGGAMYHSSSANHIADQKRM